MIYEHIDEQWCDVTRGGIRQSLDYRNWGHDAAARLATKGDTPTLENYGRDGNVTYSNQTDRVESVGTGMTRVNVGCGPHPTPGWTNYDNSLSVRLSVSPFAVRLLSKMRVLTDPQARLALAAAQSGVRHGNALSLDHPDCSVSVVYSSHMLEHLDRRSARAFLAEAFRVLKPGGILRLVVPDLKLLVESYLASGDADQFVEESLLAVESPRSIADKIRYVMVGSRHHAWMYDAASLQKIVIHAGFSSVQSVPAGYTIIDDPAGLDLRERERDSIYVEAMKPAKSEL